MTRLIQIIIGSIVIKGRNPDTVRAALVELNLAIGLFEKAAKDSDRAKRSLPILLRMQEKAHNAARNLTESPLAGLADDLVVREERTAEGDDELLIFAGKNRLVKEEPREDVLPHIKQEEAASSLTTSLHLPNGSSPFDFGLLPSSSSRNGILGRNPRNISRTSSLDQHRQNFISSHHVSSPSDATAPTLPPTPDDTMIMNRDLPDSWSAWSDQEALLINYISSGADMHIAQNAAFQQEPDPATFMWQDMGNANTPEESTSPDGTKINIQGHQPPSAGSSQHGFTGLFPPSSMDSQSPGFVNAPEGGLGLPQAMAQGPGMPWDMFF